MDYLVEADEDEPLFLLRFPKGKCNFLRRFFTSSSTSEESVDGGVSVPIFLSPPATVFTGTDSLLDVELDVVDSCNQGHSI